MLTTCSPPAHHLLCLHVSPHLYVWQGGFGADGINMRPLWLQKHKDSHKDVALRARSRVERRANAKIAFSLSKEYEFDRVLKAPNLFRKGIHDEQDKAEKNEAGEAETQEDAQENEVQDGLVVRERRTTKSLVAELQLLRVPPTAVAGRKVRAFHDFIAEISVLCRCRPRRCPRCHPRCQPHHRPCRALFSASACRAEEYNAEQVKQRMDKLMPTIQYKKMDQGKAYLSHFLQLKFNEEKMFHHGREIRHVTDGRSNHGRMAC